MIWRTNTPGLWRTVNPGLLFGAILVALVLLPWWAWGQQVEGGDRDGVHVSQSSNGRLSNSSASNANTGGRIRLNNTLETGNSLGGAPSGGLDNAEAGCLGVAFTRPPPKATPTPRTLTGNARHWHCWLGSACRTRECVESPLGCNGVPMAAWGTDPDLCPPPEQCVYYFCDGVSRELVAVPRHLCLAVGGDTPEWPLPR